jgi:hypothetical protein
MERYLKNIPLRIMNGSLSTGLSKLALEAVIK